MPVLGYPALGSLTSSIGVNDIFANRVVATEPGTLLRLKFRMRVTTQGDFKAAVYSDNGLTPPSPVAPIAQTVEYLNLPVESSYQWRVFTLLVPLAFAAVPMYFMLWARGTADILYAVAGAYAGQAHSQVLLYGPWPNPFVSLWNGAQYGSNYGEYMPSVARRIGRANPHAGI